MYTVGVLVLVVKWQKANENMKTVLMICCHLVSKKLQEFVSKPVVFIDEEMHL